MLKWKTGNIGNIAMGALVSHATLAMVLGPLSNLTAGKVIARLVNGHGASCNLSSENNIRK